MGLVLRFNGYVWVRSDNFQIINTINVKKIPIENRIKRKAFDIVLYDQGDFDYFYFKHIARNDKTSAEYTVLVKGIEEIPSKGETTYLFVDLLEKGFIDWNKDVNTINLRLPYRSRVWSSVLGEFIDSKTKNMLLIRDVRNSTVKQLYDIETRIGEKTYQFILTEWQKSFTKEGEFAIKNIYFIDEFFVI